MVHKNHEAIGFSKVKGHAKPEHIKAGLTTAEKAKGSDKSDEAAEEGHKLHNNFAANLSEWFQLRHAELETTMNGIHQVLIGMLHVNRAKRAEK